MQYKRNRIWMQYNLMRYKRYQIRCSKVWCCTRLIKTGHTYHLQSVLRASRWWSSLPPLNWHLFLCLLRFSRWYWRFVRRLLLFIVDVHAIRDQSNQMQYFLMQYKRNRIGMRYKVMQYERNQIWCSKVWCCTRQIKSDTVMLYDTNRIRLYLSFMQNRNRMLNRIRMLHRNRMLCTGTECCTRT